MAFREMYRCMIHLLSVPSKAIHEHQNWHQEGDSSNAENLDHTWKK